MPRPTKSDIERSLLRGEAITWVDAKKKSARLVLPDAKQRRLLAFLLGTKVRSPTELSKEFIEGLWRAFSGTDDPARASKVSNSAEPSATAWRLYELESEGFGGLNTWRGPLFRVD